MPSLRLPALPNELPLLAYVASLPSLALGFYSLSNHDATRIVQLAVLLVTALAAMAVSIANPSGAQWRPSSAHCLVGLLALASIAMSPVPAMAWRETALMLGLAGTTWVVAGRLSVTSLAPARQAALLGSCLYAFVLAMLMLAPLVHRSPMDWSSLAVGYDNYRFFNHVQTVALPLLAIVALQPAAERHGRWMRAAAWFSMVVYWIFVFCSGARGTALGIAVAMVAACLVSGWRATAALQRTLVASALVGAAAYALVFVLLPATSLLPVGASAERSMPSLASDSSRLLLWHIAWDDILASPWLGIGPMHYAHFPNPKAAHPHNVYLQVAAEWGLPLLATLLALAGRALWRLGRAVRDAATGARDEGAGLLVACLAFLADGFVSGNFVMPVSQMWIVLCIAWAMAWHRMQGAADSARPPVSVAWPRAAAAVLLASQVWLVAQVWPEARDVKAHFEQVPRETAPNSRPSPRFWSDGWF